MKRFPENICIVLLLFTSVSFGQQTGISANRKKADVFYTKGLQLANKGKADLAITEFQNAIKTDSTYITIWLDLGAVFDKIKRKDDAVASFEEFLKKQPKDINVLKRIVEIFYDERQYDKAMDTCQRILAFYPENAYALCRAGSISDMLRQDIEVTLEYYCKAYATINQRKDNFSLEDQHQFLSIESGLSSEYRFARIDNKKYVSFAMREKWEKFQEIVTRYNVDPKAYKE